MKRLLFILLLLPVYARAQIVTTVAGNGTMGYSGDGGPATAADFNRPAMIRFNHSGNMYVTDWINNVVRKIDALGIVTTVAGNGYGHGMTGVGGYTGDGGPATAAELNGPADVAFDVKGNMYISDDDNAVIRKVDALGIITTIAGNGTIGYNGDNIQATAALLGQSGGIILDNIGNLYLTDQENLRIRKIDTFGIITTIAGNGTPGYTGDGGPATNAQLRGPTTLALSPSDELYFPDYIAHCVRKINKAGIISTVAGNGTSAYNGDGGPATAAGIGGCNSVVFDNSGNYYISN